MKAGKQSKTYCIITPRLSGMGGAQLYALRRMNFLRKAGHRPVAIVSDDQNFILKEKFNDFEIFVFPELAHPVFRYSKKSRHLIIDRIIKALNNYTTNLILESHTLTLSIWCELIAESSDNKHIIYSLNERTILEWEFLPVKEFFLWKQDRMEFIGASYQSLKLMLGDSFRTDKVFFSNIGFDPEELPEKSVPDLSGTIDRQSFRIGTISRLSKPYVQLLIDSVVKIGSNHPDKNITLIIAGDDTDGNILPGLRKKYTGTERIRILFPGYINPLGRDFFENLDVFIGMATAAINSISLKRATITVDPVSKMSSGFFGLTSTDSMFADKDKLFPLDHWIEMALTRPSLVSEAQLAGFRLFQREYCAETCLQKVEEYITASNSDHTYWSFTEGYLSSNVYRLRYHLLNSTIYKLLQQIYSLIKR